MVKPMLKLIYFNIPGKAQSIRLALHFMGVEFENYVFADREEFQALKASGRLMFGQVPALEVTLPGQEPLVLNQTNAILRYVAKLSPSSEMYPLDPILAARVDAICDQEADTLAGIRITKYKERFGFGFLAEDRHTELLEGTVAMWHAEVAPRHLSALDAVLAAGGTGWLAGTTGPTIADFVWGPTLQQLKEGWSGDDGKALAAFPKLVDYLGRFMALPKVADYYANHM